MSQSPFWKPKFIQSAFVQVTGAYFVFAGLMDASGYITLSSLVLGMFTAGSVLENKLMKP